MSQHTPVVSAHSPGMGVGPIAAEKIRQEIFRLSLINADLLAALEGIMELLTDHIDAVGGACDSRCEPECVVAVACAAIAKAKGEVTP